jgi:hypothetical protein
MSISLDQINQDNIFNCVFHNADGAAFQLVQRESCLYYTCGRHKVLWTYTPDAFLEVARASGWKVTLLSGDSISRKIKTLEQRFQSRGVSNAR